MHVNIKHNILFKPIKIVPDLASLQHVVIPYSHIDDYGVTHLTKSLHVEHCDLVKTAVLVNLIS